MWVKLHFTSAQMYKLYNLKTFLFGHIYPYLAMFKTCRRDDHYIDAYMTLLHIWWLINRIKTYRFGLSIDIGHDGVIDHM